MSVQAFINCNLEIWKCCWHKEGILIYRLDSTHNIFLQVSPVVDEASPSSTSSFEVLDMESPPVPYKEVEPHWFYCRRADDNTSWLPFSREDSEKLERVCNNGKGVYVLYVHYKLNNMCFVLRVGMWKEGKESDKFTISSCVKEKMLKSYSYQLWLGAHQDTHVSWQDMPTVTRCWTASWSGVSGWFHVFVSQHAVICPKLKTAGYTVLYTVYGIHI